MRYFGGKARIAKPLAEYLNSQLKEGQPFVDLFCGSCNVVSKINSKRGRIANDLHPQLIAMWKYVQSGGELPSTVKEDDYKEARHNKLGKFSDWYRGFIGFGCAFSGDYFKGFAKSGKRNYALNAKNSTLNKMKTMQDVQFSNKSYKDVALPENSMLYCDIPYKNSVGYSVGDFNHEEFYKWVVEKQSEGFTVLVSEYSKNVPEGWEIVWQHASKKDIRNSDGVQETTVEVLMKPKDVKLKEN